MLEEIIADLRGRRLDYQTYLQKIAALAKRVLTGLDEATPDALKTRPWLRALYDNLPSLDAPEIADAVHEPAAVYGKAADPRLELAMAIDATVRRVRNDDWRGHPARENEIKGALLPLLFDDAQEVERVFLIIKAQREY